MPKPKPKKPEKEDKRPQRERFEEAAQKAEVDQTGEEFEKAFKKIVPSKEFPRD